MKPIRVMVSIVVMEKLNYYYYFQLICSFLFFIDWLIYLCKYLFIMYLRVYYFFLYFSFFLLHPLGFFVCFALSFLF